LQLRQSPSPLEAVGFVRFVGGQRKSDPHSVINLRPAERHLFFEGSVV